MSGIFYRQTATVDAAQALGLTKVVASFSGGNDEGGYDGFKFYGADGELLDGEPWSNFDIYELQAAYHGHSVWEAGQYVERSPVKTPMNTLAAALESILDGRYGSFAGEFCVHGEVIVDVAARTTTIEGEQSHGYDSFREEL